MEEDSGVPSSPISETLVEVSEMQVQKTKVETGLQTFLSKLFILCN